MNTKTIQGYETKIHLKQIITNWKEASMSINPILFVFGGAIFVGYVCVMLFNLYLHSMPLSAFDAEEAHTRPFCSTLGLFLGLMFTIGAVVTLSQSATDTVHSESVALFVFGLLHWFFGWVSGIYVRKMKVAQREALRQDEGYRAAARSI